MSRQADQTTSLIDAAPDSARAASAATESAAGRHPLDGQAAQTLMGIPAPSSGRASRPGRTALSAVLPPILVFILFVALLEILIRAGVIWSYIVPTPSDTARQLLSNPRLWESTAQTGLSAVIALGLSTLTGVLAAVVLSSARWIERAFYPYAVFFQTVPIIAIAPLLVVYLGYGMQTIVAAAFIVSVFPVLANTLTGLRSTDPALVDLFRLYGAGRWKTLWKLRLPAALPHLLTGLRIAAGLAVIGAIVGEFIGGSVGLGDEIVAAIPRQRPDIVYAAIVLAALLGLAFFAIINTISRITLRHWHASEQG